MGQIVTQDGTVICNGVSRPFQPSDVRSRRPPPTTADPRERDPNADPRDVDYDAYRALVARL